jgi:hypothetical protein
MRNLLLFAALLPASAPAWRPPMLPTPDPSWRWFEDCAGPRLGLDVVLDRKVLLHREFTVCPHDRRDPEEAEDQQLEVSFVAERAFDWENYHGDRESMPKGEHLTLSIWQMSSDRTPAQNHLVVGISVSGEKVIYQHTGIVVDIDAPAAAQVSRGLIVRTYPLRRPTGSPDAR